MPLHGTSNGGGGNFLGYIQYNAKSRMWVRPDNYQDENDKWQTDKVELDHSTLSFAIDLPKLRVGVIDFRSGGAPSKELVFNSEIVPDEEEGVHYPAEHGSHKNGFSAMIILGDDSRGPDEPGTVREFSSNSKLVFSALGDLYGLYDAAIAEDEGKKHMIPVVSVTGHETVSHKQFGDSFKPQFAISKWIPEDSVRELFDEALDRAMQEEGGTRSDSGYPADSGSSEGSGESADDGLPF